MKAAIIGLAFILLGIIGCLIWLGNADIAPQPQSVSQTISTQGHIQ